MDEKGFLLGVTTRSKRVFSRGAYEAGGRTEFVQDGSREFITVLACICADGTALPPTLIYKAASNNVHDTWLQGFDPHKHQVGFTSSESGWTNNEIGLLWLKDFDRYTKAKARNSYRLLILDGHNSHVSVEFIEYCDQNKILLTIFPPHSTHTLQPLDVVIFKPLSSAYSTQITQFMMQSRSYSSLTKRDFFHLFYRAWQTAFIEKTILKAFEATGLAPFNPSQILNKFCTQSASDDHGELAEDWESSERFVREAVIKNCDNTITKLCQLYWRLSARFKLQDRELQGLICTIISERKRRQRAKALPQPDDQTGAVIYTPTKVVAARQKQREIEESAKQSQLQKLEKQQLRSQQKEQKLLEKEERRVAQYTAREARLMRAAALADEKAARKAAKRLHDVAKAAQKRISRTSKASNKPATKKKSISSRRVDGVAQSKVIATPIVTSRRARKITTPAKFR